MAVSVTPGQQLTSDEWQAFFAAHGGAKSVINISAKKDPKQQILSGEDQNPVYRYYANDGSYVEARAAENGEDYAVVDAHTAPKDPANDPSAVAQDKLATELQRQREVNAGLPQDQDPRYETDAERAARARQTIADQRQAGIDADQRQRLEAQRVVSTTYEGTGQNRVKVTTYGDDHQVREAAPQEKRAIGTHYEADGTKVTEYDDGTTTREAASPAESRAAAAANRPSIISAPPGQRKIAQMDNAGNVSSVDNPNFDEAAYNRQEAQAKAKTERDRLSLQIEAGKLSEASAAAQYKRWFDENVTLPMQRAQEARARAAELRQAQEAEDRRQQFAASYEKDRQTTAIQAGNQAANAFNSNLQYQVGPAFGDQFAQALNSFQPGAPPANFTADAFTFKGPSIEAVARKATAKALAGISPYAQAIAAGGQREPQVASYGPGTDIPDIAPSAAPPPSTPPDYAGMINQYLQNNPYVPGGGDQEDQ